MFEQRIQMKNLNNTQNKKKICVVTSSRADYGLLSILLKKINSDKSLILQSIITGSHLEKNYGYTLREIKHDGLKPTKIIRMNLSVDTYKNLTDEFSKAISSFNKCFLPYHFL